MPVNVGNILQPVVFVQCRTVKTLRPVEFIPFVGPGDELRRRLARHVIERDPQADGLAAVHAIIGRVLMPRCRHACSRLLDQDMFVEQLNLLAVHQFRANSGSVGVENKFLVFGDAGPVAVIDKKAAAAILASVDARVRVGVSHIGVHTPAKHIHPVGKHTPEDGNALFPELA